jgi:segregation and condensation protein B
VSEPLERVTGAIEALLFVSDEPVTASRLAGILETSVRVVEDALQRLAAGYAAGERGFQLREVAGGWRLYTHPAYHREIGQYVLSWDTRRLSQAALEALAVIAYHQPVTRQGVNAVRGVNSEAVISSLMEKGLVREAGRDRNAGNAILYCTTTTFLERFGLNDLSELPPLEEFAPDADTERAIRERLTALESDVPGLDTEDAEEDGAWAGDEAEDADDADE